MLANQIFSDDNDANTCRTNVLLGASVYDAEFSPVNWSGAEVRAHITDQNLAFRDLIKGEIMELESLNRFVVAVVEI